HAEKEAQLFGGRSKVLSRLAATSIHTENHNINVTKKEFKQCNIHGIILPYFTSRIRKVGYIPPSTSARSFLQKQSGGAANFASPLLISVRPPLVLNKRETRFMDTSD